MFIIRLIRTFPLITCILTGTILLNIRKHKTDALSHKQKESFWEKESRANAVRKKDLSCLHYITIPEKNLPFFEETTDKTLQNVQQKMKKLISEPIVNFTGYTNTELKLEYGAANLPVLSNYDMNFTELCRTLNVWGQRLSELGYRAEARTVLEYAVSIGSDVSGTYKLLATLYVQSGEAARIDDLIKAAEQLRSLSKQVILNALTELKTSAVSTHNPVNPS